MPEHSPFTIKDGILFVPSWEWDSTQSVIFDSAVEAKVYDFTSSREVQFDFENGWTLSLYLSKMDDRRGENEWAAVFTTTIFDGPRGERTESFPNLDTVGVLAVIREIVTRGRPPRRERCRP